MDILEQFYQITLSLLPIFGIILLIVIIVLVIRLLTTVKKVNGLLDNVDGTVTSVNGTLDDIKKPVAVVVRTTNYVDSAYDKAEEFLGSTANKILKASGGVTGLYEKFLKKDKSTTNNSKVEKVSDFVADTESVINEVVANSKGE